MRWAIKTYGGCDPSLHDAAGGWGYYEQIHHVSVHGLFGVLLLSARNRETSLFLEEESIVSGSLYTAHPVFLGPRSRQVVVVHPVILGVS